MPSGRVEVNHEPSFRESELQEAAAITEISGIIAAI